MVDEGFRIDDLVPCKVYRPPFQLSHDEVLVTQDIARLRIHVERIIQRIKEIKLFDTISSDHFWHYQPAFWGSLPPNKLSKQATGQGLGQRTDSVLTSLRNWILVSDLLTKRTVVLFHHFWFLALHNDFKKNRILWCHRCDAYLCSNTRYVLTSVFINCLLYLVECMKMEKIFYSVTMWYIYLRFYNAFCHWQINLSRK